MPPNFTDFSVFLIFFVYGLAFFSMGLVLFVESSHAPHIEEVRLLLPLAIFGFIHGTHEWIEMALMQKAWFSVELPNFAIWLRFGILAISFLTLQIFVLHIFLPGLQKFWLGLLACLTLLLLLVAVWLGLNWQSLPTGWVAMVDASIRYSLAIPGALAAAIAILQHARRAASLGNHRLVTGWTLTAFSLAGYAFSQSVVQPSNFLLAGVWNTSVFFNLFGFPVQGLRAALAVLITIGLILAVQAMEAERQKELLAAQKARFEALEQMQGEARARHA